MLNAVQKSGIYQMKFGGLFDCAKPKIHGLGLLIYDNVASDIDAAFREMETNYEDFVNIEGTIVNPLNYAPPSLTPQPRLPKIDERHLRVPISQLEHLPSPKLNDSSYFFKCIFGLLSDFFFFLTFSGYAGKTLKEKPDKTFYLAYDLLPKTNPEFFSKEYYTFEQVEGQNKLRTPQLNNISLMVIHLLLD